MKKLKKLELKSPPKIIEKGLTLQQLSDMEMGHLAGAYGLCNNDACGGDGCNDNLCNYNVCGGAVCGDDLCNHNVCGIEMCAEEACNIDICSIDYI